MVSQTEFTLRPRTRGFHLITDEVVRNLPPLPQIGLLYLFIKLWGIERSGFFNGREKWAKGFENQRV